MTTAHDKLLETEDGRRALCIEQTITNVTELICERLEESEMSRTELAEHMGVSPGRITQVLDGEANLTLRSVARALAAFGHILSVSSKPPAARGEGEADAIIKALTDNMGNPTIEQPDARPFAEVLRHLASLMDEKKWLTHMAKPSSESAKGWAKLLNAKADQIDAAIREYLRRSPTLADEEIEAKARTWYRGVGAHMEHGSANDYAAMLIAFAKSLRDGERRGA